MFRVARRTVELPIAVVKDVATMGMRKAMDESFYTEDKLDDIKFAIDNHCKKIAMIIYKENGFEDISN